MGDRKELLLCHDLIVGVVAALEARDIYTACHSMRVARTAELLCHRLNLLDEDAALIHIAAHLHDIGKIGVDDAVLRKQGALSEPEWEQIRRHPLTGYEILCRIQSFAEIAVIVLHHHERWDGGGCPDGLCGEAIPLGSRIIAVADSIDAMMSDRSYRRGMSPARCREQIQRNSGVMYDPDVAAAALENWPELIKSRAEPSSADRPFESGEASFPAEEVSVPSGFPSGAHLEKMREIRAYLLEHLDQKICLNQLCGQFYLSPSTLKRRFKDAFGIPPDAYLRQQRLSTARRLLCTTSLSIAEIAVRVGYESPSRFTAVFKRCYHQTPLQFRKSGFLA